MKKKTLILLVFSLLIGAGCQQKQRQSISKTTTTAPVFASFCTPKKAVLDTPPGFDGTLTPLFAGLTENFTYPVTTKSKVAQKYFDQGLILSYGFNHSEAARSFKEATRQDPECAMCWWGLGYVLGPNYNVPMEVDVLPQANEAVAQARLFMHQTSAKEQALINALSRRYPKTKEEDPQSYYEAYAGAMGAASRQFPDDLDIAAMHAEALMDLHPWDLYDKQGEPKSWTPEILGILENILHRNPRHPQAIHLYIHATEASSHPERAVPFANTLRNLVPGAGHLVHMPSHTYIRSGMYHEGVLANERAVKMDSLYLEACSEAGVYGLALYPHNWHMLAACAALEGKGKRALEASRFMAEHVVNRELMRIPDLATLQHYLTIPWYIQVKFAAWDDILQEPAPEADLVYPNAVWHYARGMAFSGKGDFSAARRELAEVERLDKDPSIQELSIWGFNKLTDITRIARHVLEADIAWREGHLDKSLTLLRKAAAFEDELQYQEPPDWFFSTRHLLGHVLLLASRYSEAETVFKEDLSTWKENGWALIGLYQSLEKQGKKEEARSAKARLDKAWQHADKPLNSSVL